MPLKPCLDCGALTPGTRCPEHTRAKDRATLRTKRARRPRLPGEDTRRAATVQAHIGTHGYWCPGWQRPPHPSQDLTADHPHAVARGGDEQAQSLTVLCRSCNSRKGAQG